MMFNMSPTLTTMVHITLRSRTTSTSKSPPSLRGSHGKAEIIESPKLKIAVQLSAPSQIFVSPRQKSNTVSFHVTKASWHTASSRLRIAVQNG
jgi:hypothetical protein